MMRIKAPARICLFGEHQDYLNYPIIAMAISKYIYLEAKKITEQKFNIELPDINETLEIPLKNIELEYKSKRDYLVSGYNQFIRKGIRFNKGYSIKITGDIPINAGAASSSALVMAWLYFLNQISSEPIKSKSALAIEGYNVEVKEFGEAGGMMDHYTSIFGNLIYLQPEIPQPNILSTDIKLDGFVLGDSLEKKETVNDLNRVKDKVVKGFKALKEVYTKFDKFKTSLDEIHLYIPNLENEYQNLVLGNIINRDITMKAKKLIFEDFPSGFNISTNARNNFYQELGSLINLHHEQLMGNIEIYTKKIEFMVDNCLEAGAFGAKINGSGFGGTMFALTTPGDEDALVSAIEEAGGKAYKIETSKGVAIY